MTFLSSCSSPSGDEQKQDTQDSSQTNTAELDKQPVKTIIDFYKWYRSHTSPKMAPSVIDTAFVKGDTTKYYRVNFKGTEEYLADVKSSGFVSEKYIQYWRDDFKRSDEYMQKNHENDGPPNGFDYDFMTLSQEDIGLDSLERVKVIDISKEKGSTFVKLEFLYQMSRTFQLHEENGKWLIDSIAVANGH